MQADSQHPLEKGNKIDQIDTIWSSFRLPIPITTTNSNDNKTNGGPYDEWLLQVLDLLRLLHTMNQQYQTAKTSNSSAKNNLMNSQMKLAYSHLDRIQRTFPPISSSDDVDNDEMIINNQMFHQNLHTLLQKLRYDTEEICVKYQRWLANRHQDNHNNITTTMVEEGKERDLIYDMFLAKDDAYEKGGEQNDNDSEELLLDDFSDDDNGILDEKYEANNEPASSSTPVQNQFQQQQMRKQHHPRRRDEEVDPVEFQKQQQELLEQELSDMATRLKQSTLAMNATLQTQTKDLDDMEEIAQSNLDQVTDTAKKVEQRLQAKRGWKKRVATWSLVGTVIGMWILCFVVMRTVPKRQVGEVHFFKRGKVSIQNIWDRIKPTMDDRNEREYAAKYAAMFENMEDDDWDSEDEEEWQQQRREQNQDKQRAWEQQHQKQQKRQDYDEHEEEEEECEILGDGTQICPNEDERMEAKVRELAAEKKRRRIEEKMANAPIVEAVEGGLDNVHVKQEDTQDDNNDHDDSMGCIPLTDAMRIQQSAKESLMKALEDINKLHQKTQPGSTQRMNLERHISKMEEDLKKHSSMLEMEMNNARSTFWADKTNIIKARDLKRALGSIPFCSGDDAAVNKNNEEELNIERERQRRIDETKRREEFQQRWREEQEAQRKAEELMEKQRLASEKAAKQAELERLEQERLAKEKQAELERIEKERIQKAEAERLEQERLAAETKRLQEQERLAVEAAKQAELDRLEQKREEEKLAAEEARLKAERIEKEKLEAENIEKEKLAVEEAKRVELEMLEQKRLLEKENVLEKARAEASEAVKLATQIAMDSPEFHPADVRVAAGNKKNDLLAHYISSAPEMVDASDRRGWSPIHEAARAGNLAGIQLLVDAGCDLTSRTGRKGDGGTALWWAVQRYGEDHDVVQLLRSHGALEAGPET